VGGKTKRDTFLLDKKIILKRKGESFAIVFIFFLVSFGACLVGSICGMGGGVIIKPVLDACGILSVSTINFLSGCTVLGMTAYSVGKALKKHESVIDLQIGTPLAIGAAVGGLIGKQLFQITKAVFADSRQVSGLQAALLMSATFGTLLYTLRKQKIHTHQLKNMGICLAIGFALGAFSSFLGIGGGPFNLVVLFFFFSMSAKEAAQNSLYIILFSQATSLAATLATRTVPEFSWRTLAGMILFGILGSEAGRRLNKKLNENGVTRLFEAMMGIIILLNLYNVWFYLH
jgi:uncharacterized membrane protein YfcA